MLLRQHLCLSVFVSLSLLSTVIQAFQRLYLPGHVSSDHSRRTHGEFHLRPSTRLHKRFTLEVDSVIMDERFLETLHRLLAKRSAARQQGDYAQADDLKRQIDALPLPPGYELLIEDLPYRTGGGSNVKLSYQLSRERRRLPGDAPGVLQLAHAALGMAVSHAERNVVLSESHVEDLAEHAKKLLQGWQRADRHLRLVNHQKGFAGTAHVDLSRERLESLQNESEEDVSCWFTIEEDLGGRKAADAAFWFSLAGARDEELFDLLALVSAKEIGRFGDRPSCRVKDLNAIRDKLAAAGIRRSPVFEKAMAECLEKKSREENLIMDTDTKLRLHGDSCSLMVWKFASRQRKQKSFLNTAAKHWESTASKTESYSAGSSTTMPKKAWQSTFADSTRPLVIDVGCGMGLSLLGLASATSTREKDHCELIPWSGCNFVGVDLSSLAIRYAGGLAARWKLRKSLCFVVDSAEQLLTEAMEYPGPIDTILIQFPTPYRLITPDLATGASEAHGNLQLPTSIEDGFMVAPALLQLIHQVLSEHCRDGVCGRLIVQSNCEDVALFILESAMQLGFKAELADFPVLEPGINMSERTSRWIASGGARAVGPFWSSKPLLPREAWTETEVACQFNDTPVHRCVLRPTHSKNSSDS